MTAMLCTIVAGCGSSSYKKADITYTSINILMETKKDTVNALGDVANTCVLVYDLEGNLLSATPNTKGYEDGKKLRYSGGMVARESIASVTVVFLDSSYNTLGVASKKIDTPDGKNATETYDMGTIYKPDELAGKYSLEVKLLSESSYNVNFEAYLTTPEGRVQDVTSQSTIMYTMQLTDWDSSNTEVLTNTTSGQGNFTVKGSGTTTITATFADKISDTYSYTVK